MSEKIIVVAPTTAVPMSGFAVALKVLPQLSFSSDIAWHVQAGLKPYPSRFPLQVGDVSIRTAHRSTGVVRHGP